MGKRGAAFFPCTAAAPPRANVMNSIEPHRRGRRRGARVLSRYNGGGGAVYLSGAAGGGRNLTRRDQSSRLAACILNLEKKGRERERVGDAQGGAEGKFKGRERGMLEPRFFFFVGAK